MPRLLAPHGYRSAFFTPGHLRFENDARTIKNRGFELVKGEGDYPTEGFERSNYYGHEDCIMPRPSFDWLDSVVAAKRPFFLTYMTLTGHHDYQVPSTFKKQRYAGVADDQLNDYLNALRYVHDWLRELFDGFQARGLLESTVFFIVGYYGQSFGEHGARQHVEVLYDEALRVPALIYAPSLWTKPGRISGPRQQIDLLPTVADVLGYKLEGGYLAGQSLLQPVPADRALYFMCWHEGSCIALRDGPKKYIYSYDNAPLQAFDLARDSVELNDLGPSLSEAQKAEIERRLLTWRESLGAGLHGAARALKSRSRRRAAAPAAERAERGRLLDCVLGQAR